MTAPDPHADARLEYEKLIDVFALLTDVRFKLLALVPTVSGTAVALLTSDHVDGVEQAVVAALGALATLGIVFYDQRNTQLYNNVVGRAQHIEKLLGLTRAETDRVGGLFRSRNPRPRRLLGLVPMWHDRGLALVYAPVVGAWAFAVAEAVTSRRWAVVAGAAAGVVMYAELERQNGTGKRIRDAYMNAAAAPFTIGR